MNFLIKLNLQCSSDYHSCFTFETFLLRLSMKSAGRRSLDIFLQ